MTAATLVRSIYVLTVVGVAVGLTESGVSAWRAVLLGLSWPFIAAIELARWAVSGGIIRP